mgnify:FL=1
MKNKIILITGVSSGMGKAFVLYALKHMGEEGVIVGLGRNNIEEIENKQYFFIKTDLRNQLSIKKTIGEVRKKFGRVDVLINNAGLGYRGTIEEECFWRVQAHREDINYARYWLSRYLAWYNTKRKHGGYGMKGRTPQQRIEDWILIINY